MKRIKIVLYILIISVLYMSGCKSTAKPEEKTEHEVLAPNTVELTGEQVKTANIQLGKVEQRSMSSTLKVNGSIAVTPQSFATVCAPFGGFIKQTNLVEGSLVTKGQTLALIENSAYIDIQQNYFETKAKFEFAEKEYIRQKDLYSSNINSAKIFQQADADYKTLKAQLNGYIQKLSLLGIDAEKLKEDKISSILPLVSPINGYVKKINVNIGKSISSSDILFEVINTQGLTLELIVFEKDVQKISVGQKLKFATANSPETSYIATVYQIGKVLDGDRTVKVYASINKTDDPLIAGMYINAEIEISNNLTTCLPDECIVQFDEKYYVFAFKEKAMENGKEVIFYEVIEVTKGAANNGFSEIIFVKTMDYLNKQIVIKGAYSILSKFKNSGEMSC